MARHVSSHGPRSAMGLTLSGGHDINRQTNSVRDGAPDNSASPSFIRAHGLPCAVSSVVVTTYFATDPTEVRISVSAVVRRHPRSNEILLMRRSDNEHWGLPGGYVEPGESVMIATQREVREETGYEIEVGPLFGVYSDPSTQVIEYADRRRVQAINLCFSAIAGPKGELTTPEETLEVGFFDAGALPQPFVPIHEIRVADAARADDRVRVR